MTFPPGKWSVLLVGDQWPDEQDMATLLHGKANRATVRSHATLISDLLRSAQIGPLGQQEGHTADDLRDTFRAGEGSARAIAEKNGVKESAYSAAYESMVNLRNDLAALADEGNKKIEAVENSRLTSEQKFTQIVSLMNYFRTIANGTAAKYGSNVLDEMQHILNAEGSSQSARQFAETHGGVNIGQLFHQPSNQQELEDRIRATLGKPEPQVLQNGQLPPTSLRPEASIAPGPQLANGEKAFQAARLPTVSSAVPGECLLPRAAPTARQALQVGKLPPSSAGWGAVSPDLSVSRSPMTSSAVSEAFGTSTGMSAGLPVHSAPPLFGSLPTEAIHAPAPVTFSPNEFAQNFNNGLESNAQIAPLMQAASSTPGASAEPHTSTPPDLPTPRLHTHALEVPAPHTPPSEAPPQMVAAPIAPPNPITPPVTPASPLPSYGSDIRPPVATTISSPPPSPSPPPAAPTSAPVHPSSGQSNANQPSVVRHGPPPTKSAPPPNVATEAAVATATGAAAGAASAKMVARQRLERLVASVARQQPRLAWAAGERADNTTVLATDLSSGWIPPGIALPATVTLLPPQRRRGNLEAMLGEVIDVAKYTPVHHVPEDNEPPPTSTRPRQAPEIDELGWELSNATQWRDGLPRLAHTLAKATSAGTGVLDSEIDLLHEHITTVSTKILDGYPDRVDPQDVGNLQLLAAIDALVAGDRTVANYHLAWFLACSNNLD